MSAQLHPSLPIGQLRKAAAAASEGEPPRESASVARDVPSLPSASFRSYLSATAAMAQ